MFPFYFGRLTFQQCSSPFQVGQLLIALPFEVECGGFVPLGSGLVGRG